MPHDFWFVLHAGHQQPSASIYLYRVLLHLVAFAALGVGTRWVYGFVVAMTAESGTRPNADRHEP